MAESKNIWEYFTNFLSHRDDNNIKLHYNAKTKQDIDEDDFDLETNNIHSKTKSLKRQQTCSFDLSDKTLRLRNTQELSSIDSTSNIHRRSSFNLDRDFPKKLLSISDFEEKEILGEGAFGRAIKVEHIKSGCFFVLKEVVSHTKENEESLIREVSILRSLKHTNVLTTVGLVLKDKRICLLTELMHGGSLQAKILNIDEEININQKLLFLRDIASGMNFLHNNSIMHRDLTSSNCLLRKDNTVVVSDFGLSKIINQDIDSSKFFHNSSNEMPRCASSETINTVLNLQKSPHLELILNPRLRNYLSVGNIRELNERERKISESSAYDLQTSEKRKQMNIRRKHTVVGNPFWMAPEMLAGKNYNCLVDLYSFGIIGCEITARISANPDYLERIQKDMSVNFKAFVQKHKNKELKQCPEGLLELIESCCQPNPDDRPTFNSILSSVEDILFRVTNNVQFKMRWSNTALDSD